MACHSKECAPPPAGKGGSSAGSGEVRSSRDGLTRSERDARYRPYYEQMKKGNRQTVVTRDGQIAVSKYGGRKIVFKTRSGKTKPWKFDAETTKMDRLRVGE